MDASDIEGTKPGWRPHALFAAQQRDPLRLDICASARDARRAPRGGLQGELPARAASAQETAVQPPPLHAIALPLSARGGWGQGGDQGLPEYGVAYTADWRKQRAEAKIRQGEVARTARQAADDAIAAAAARAAAAAGAAPAPAPGPGSSSGAAGGPASSGAAAGAAGLASMVKSLKAFDREGCGRVQVGGPAEWGPGAA